MIGSQTTRVEQPGLTLFSAQGGGGSQSALDDRGDDRLGRTDPTHARVASCRWKNGLPYAEDFRRQVRLGCSGDKETSACRRTTEMPECRVLVPGTAPAEPIPEDQPVAAVHEQLLDQGCKLELFRGCAAGISARKPDVAPNQSSPFSELDARPLIIPAAAE